MDVIGVLKVKFDTQVVSEKFRKREMVLTNSFAFQDYWTPKQVQYTPTSHQIPTTHHP